MFIKLSDLSSQTESSIRADFSNTSFPTPFVPPESYAVLFPAPQPVYDPITQFVREATPELTDKGHWEQRWEVVPKFTDYTDEDGVDHTAAEQEQAAIDADKAEKAAYMLKACDTALTAHLDATAKQRRYDNRITCMVRAGFSGPFQAEAIAFATWCDTCNATAYQLLAEVQAGTRPLPDTTQALIDVLPPMVWPT